MAVDCKDRVLVTGGTGFLGSWCCYRLLQEGYQVHIFDKQVSDLTLLRDIAGDDAEKVVCHQGDICDLGSVEAAVKQVDAVFHLAGVIAYDSKLRNLMEKVNVDGTAAIVEACKRAKVKRLVHLSSIAAIGFSTDGKHVITEADQYFVGSYNLGYFETKHQGEVIVLDAVRRGEIDAVVLNPTTIYGPGDAYKSSRGNQVKTAMGKQPFYTGGGVNVVAVQDAVECILKAYQIGKTGERYIVGGENITIKTLLYTIAEEAAVKPPRLYIPNWLMKIIGYFNLMNITWERAITTIVFHWGDSTKARTELGVKFRPAREAIRGSVGWMKTHGIIGTSPPASKTD